jgi:hypothetical protein
MDRYLLFITISSEYVFLNYEQKRKAGLMD